MASVKHFRSVVAVGLALAPCAIGQIRRPSVKTLVERMLTDSEQFQAKALHAHGLAGMEATLDRLFPDTAPLPKSEIARAKRFVKQLSSKRFQVRQKASDGLIAIGPPVRKYLTKASGNAPLEVVRRVKVIMAALGQVDEAGDDLRGYARYVRGIEDAPRISLLAERVATALESGMPKSSRRDALKLCLSVVVRSNWTGYSKSFESLLKQRDVGMVEFLLDEIGSHVRFSASFPSLLTGTYEVKDRKTWKAFRAEFDRRILDGKALATQRVERTSLVTFKQLVKPGWVSSITAERIADFVAKRRLQPGKKKG